MSSAMAGGRRGPKARDLSPEGRRGSGRSGPGQRTPATPNSYSSSEQARGYNSPEIKTCCPQPVRPFPMSAQTIDWPLSPTSGVQEAATNELRELAGAGPVVGQGRDASQSGIEYNNIAKAMTDRPLSSISTCAGQTPAPEEWVAHPSQLLDGLRSTPDNTTSTGNSGDSKKAQAKKIFVGGIPQEMGQSDLTRLMSTFAPVKKAWLQKHRQNGQGQGNPQNNHRGFGFVIFEDEGGIDKILGNSDSRFIPLPDGKKRLEVKRAMSSSEISSTTTPSKAKGSAASQAAPAQQVQSGQPQQNQVPKSGMHGVQSQSQQQQQQPQQVQYPAWSATPGNYMHAPQMQLQHPHPQPMMFAWIQHGMPINSAPIRRVVPLHADNHAAPQAAACAGAPREGSAMPAPVMSPMRTPGMQLPVQQQPALMMAAPQAFTPAPWQVQQAMMQSEGRSSPVPESQGSAGVPMMSATQGPPRAHTPEQQYEAMILQAAMPDHYDD